MKILISFLFILCSTTILINASSYIACDNEIACPNNYHCITCNGEIGCCRFPNAICCGNGQYCCPQNSTCDVANMKCRTLLRFDFLKQESVEMSKNVELSKESSLRLLSSNQEGCKSISINVVKMVASIILLASARNEDFKNDQTIGNIKSLSDLINQYNEICIDLSIKYSLPILDLSQIFYVGLASHDDSQSSKLSSIESQISVLCHDKVDTLLGIVRLIVNSSQKLEEENMNNNIKLLRDLIKKMSQENSICNQKLLLLSKHFNDNKPLGSSPNSVTVDKSKCSNYANEVVINVNEMIKQSESKENYEKPMFALSSKLFNLLNSFNKECIDMTQKFMVPVVDIKSLYYYGLGNHISNEENSVEEKYLQFCKDKLETLLNSIENGFIGFKDLNNYSEVLNSVNNVRNLMSNLRKENTACNTFIDRIYTHFNQIAPKVVPAATAVLETTKGNDEKLLQCEKIAKSIIVEVSELISHSEDSVPNSILMMSKSNTIYQIHLNFNKFCVDMRIKYSLPYYDLKSVYKYGLEVHSANEKNSDELNFIKYCNEKIGSFLNIIEKGNQGFQDLNKLSFVTTSHSELKTAVKNLRRENTVCNNLLDSLYKHLSNENQSERSTSDVLRKINLEKCRNIAQSVLVPVNQIIKKTEDSEKLDDLITLCNNLSNLVSSFNKECVETNDDSVLIKVNLKGLYIYGLNIHLDKDVANKPEEQYLKSCKDRIEKIVDIIEEELIQNNDSSSTAKVSTATIKLREFLKNMRRENTACNSFMDKVTAHFQ